MLLEPSLKLTNAILSPSGDQLGSKSFASSSVNLVTSLPSSFIVYISKLPFLLLLKAICPLGPGNVPAHALWLVGITRRLGRSSIAEIPKRKANFRNTREDYSSYSSATSICRYYFCVQKGFICYSCFFYFQINVPNSYF